MCKVYDITTVCSKCKEKTIKKNKINNKYVCGKCNKHIHSVNNSGLMNIFNDNNMRVFLLKSIITDHNDNLDVDIFKNISVEDFCELDELEDLDDFE